MILYALYLSLFVNSFNIPSPARPAIYSQTHNEEALLVEDIWKVLLKVKYSFHKNTYIPSFDDKIKALDGKIVTIKGFMYPIDEKLEHEFFYISYYPVNVCFFCGGAGPESVIEVNSQKAIPLKNKAIQVKGKLKLNYKDRQRLFFILLNAEVI